MDPDIPVAYATATLLPPPVGLASVPSGTPMAHATATTDNSSAFQSAATATAYSYPSSHQHGGPPPPGRPSLQQAAAMNGRSSRFMLPQNGQENVLLTQNVVESLMAQGFTQGLAEALQLNKRAFPLAMWIVDNSGSMAQRDGHRFVETGKSSNVKVVECTRWAEMQQTVDYHIQMAALLSSPTVFRMLNDPGRVAGPQQFSIAEHGSPTSTEVQIALQTMLNTTPGGVTPLIPHLQEVRDNILALEPQLRSEGSKVVFVMATDGLPTDARGISDRAVQQQFVEALRMLEGLPVWVVVRLCTDEEQVVDFWNDLDNQLELSLEVLDDFGGEAKEVHETNPWLNYGLPLHRMREMGFYSKLFDMLDERKLLKDELREFFRLLFGNTAMDGVPDAEADWKGFCDKVDQLTKSSGKTWNSVTRRNDYWVDMRKLKKEYAKKGWFGR